MEVITSSVDDDDDDDDEFLPPGAMHLKGTSLFTSQTSFVAVSQHLYASNQYCARNLLLKLCFQVFIILSSVGQAVLCGEYKCA